MYDYKAPVKDIQFLLASIQQQTALLTHPQLAEMATDYQDAVLEEAGRFAGGVLAPLNQPGDVQGCRWQDGQVTTPDGWKDAYQQFCEYGWMGLGMSADFGGQNLPKFIAQSVNEMWLSANIAFVMFHALNQGCSDILHHFGTDEQKARYLESIASGQVTVAMALTEPNAGSDLANTTTKAFPQEDGTYLIKGQKIFITYGEHDMSENILHLVLARTPDAPAGSRGISMFAVPKYRINPDGSTGEANDVVCSGIEHKVGLHGSPTCSMSYGDNDACVGELIGEENKGLMAMFVLMNEARLSTGMQGVAFAELSYQNAVQYALERTQGAHYRDGGRVQIAAHPDVQRMLLSIKSQAMGMRAMGLLIAALIDIADYTEDASERKQALNRVALLTPIFKAYATEQGNLTIGTCIQVFGGMGFVEETGVAQFMRDARITTIYEGTTGIQARDLVFRKILGDKGEAATALLNDIRTDIDTLAAANRVELGQLADALSKAVDAVGSSIQQILAADDPDQIRLHAGSVPLLDALGTLLTGWQLAVSAGYAQRQIEAGLDPEYHQNQIALAEFFRVHKLPQIFACLASVEQAEQGLKDYRFDA